MTTWDFFIVIDSPRSLFAISFCSSNQVPSAPLLREK